MTLHILESQVLYISYILDLDNKKGIYNYQIIFSEESYYN